MSGPERFRRSRFRAMEESSKLLERVEALRRYASRTPDAEIAAELRAMADELEQRAAEMETPLPDPR